MVEQPPKGLGTINDMWFGWIIDVGFPGPDRGEGGKYLLLPPDYDGPLQTVVFTSRGPRRHALSMPLAPFSPTTIRSRPSN